MEYDEETLWNYEVGIKTEFADRRVRLNASVFYMDWEGLQVEAFRFLTPGDLSSNFEQTVNVDAEGQGAEVELLAAVTDNFTLGGAIGYLDTEITDEPPCDVDPAMGTCIQITGGFNVTAIGLEMPKAPELTANVFGEYRWDIDSNEAWLRAEYTHRDSQYSDIEALTNQQTRGPSPNQGPRAGSSAPTNSLTRCRRSTLSTCVAGSSGNTHISRCMRRMFSTRSTTPARRKTSA